MSITQPLNTTSSLGRLTLNILLSFAEFERQMIADRTRDKMAAARRKGKWVGGIPVLGYAVAPAGGKLEVKADEAHHVRSIFALYLELRSLRATLAEMRARGWMTKHWTTKDGEEHLGRSFTKATLERLLKNVLYIGQVSHRGSVYAGEQEAIVEPAIWERAQEWLAKERTGAGGMAGTRPKKKTGKGRASPAAASEPSERVPRITRLLALARKFEELIRSGVVNDYAALAQFGRISRARVTQMTSLLNLAPDIQEEILFLKVEEAEQFRISEPSLRQLTATLLWNQQREQWRNLHRPSHRRAE